MMLQRVSAFVAMQWDWYDDKTNCWIISPDTTGVKRTFGDTTNAHVIQNTPQLEVLMNNLSAINGNQKYVFFSRYKANHPYISPQTPRDHFKNLGYQGRQDAYGLRYVASTALIDKGYYRGMVSSVWVISIMMVRLVIMIFLCNWIREKIFTNLGINY